MSTATLSRRVQRLEAIAPAEEILTDLDLLRSIEQLAAEPGAIEFMQEIGHLEGMDAEEARLRAFYAHPDIKPLPMLDGEHGRWPMQRARALWYEQTYARPGVLRSAETDKELEERCRRFHARAPLPAGYAQEIER